MFTGSLQVHSLFLLFIYWLLLFFCLVIHLLFHSNIYLFIWWPWHNITIFRGVKEVLKRRLKSYYKKQKFPKPKHISENNHQLDYYCIIDFEGTCEEKNPDGYIHEIIEFPAILVNGRTLEFVSIRKCEEKIPRLTCIGKVCSKNCVHLSDWNDIISLYYRGYNSEM